jgi:hypothetical protein
VSKGETTGGLSSLGGSPTLLVLSVSGAATLAKVRDFWPRLGTHDVRRSAFCGFASTDGGEVSSCQNVKPLTSTPLTGVILGDSIVVTWVNR